MKKILLIYFVFLYSYGNKSTPKQRTVMYGRSCMEQLFSFFTKLLDKFTSFPKWSELSWKDQIPTRGFLIRSDLYITCFTKFDYLIVNCCLKSMHAFQCQSSIDFILMIVRIQITLIQQSQDVVRRCSLILLCDEEAYTQKVSREEKLSYRNSDELLILKSRDES